MEFKQIFTPGLAHCSYVIGGKNACVVVDPAREISQYIDIAASFGLPIKGIIETHLHADFVSGHIELMEKTGAVIYINENAGAQFEHYAVKDEEEIQIDTLLFKMLHTPGHTPECSVYIVSDLERGREPVLAFTGDTLMVGDAGRPDLFPDIKVDLASKLYNSLRRIEELPDNIELYPAHGAGSLCGKSLSSKLSSTIGTEKLQNPAMIIHDKERFITSFLEEMPEVPDHFSRCSAINRKGAPAVSKLNKPIKFSPEQFYNLSLSGYTVVDTRGQIEFGSAHVPGAYALSIKGNFATFSGWVLPPDKPILLVLEDMGNMPTVLKALYSVGLDNVAGWLDGGMQNYVDSGLKTARFESISAQEAKERYDNEEIIIVDVRLKGEWGGGHVKNAKHISAPDIRNRYGELPVDKPVAFMCSTGTRSLLAVSLILKYSGTKNAINIFGGTTSWSNIGYSLVTDYTESRKE